MKTMKEVICDHLKSVGAEGLCHPDSDCGCDIKDLFPCDHCPDECVPALRYIVTAEDKTEGRFYCLEYDIGDTIYIEMDPPNAKDQTAGALPVREA